MPLNYTQYESFRTITINIAIAYIAILFVELDVNDFRLRTWDVRQKVMFMVGPCDGACGLNVKLNIY